MESDEEKVQHRCWICSFLFGTYWLISIQWLKHVEPICLIRSILIFIQELKTREYSDNFCIFSWLGKHSGKPSHAWSSWYTPSSTPSSIVVVEEHFVSYACINGADAQKKSKEHSYLRHVFDMFPVYCPAGSHISSDAHKYFCEGCRKHTYKISRYYYALSCTNCPSDRPRTDIVNATAESDCKLGTYKAP